MSPSPPANAETGGAETEGEGEDTLDAEVREVTRQSPSPPNPPLSEDPSVRFSAAERETASENIRRLRDSAEALSGALDLATASRVAQQGDVSASIARSFRGVREARKLAASLHVEERAADERLRNVTDAEKLAEALRREFFDVAPTLAAADAAAAVGLNVAGASNLPGRGPPPGKTDATSRAAAKRLFSSPSEMARIENLPPARRRAALMGIRARFHRLSVAAWQLHEILARCPAAARLAKTRAEAVARVAALARRCIRADTVDVYVADHAAGVLRRYVSDDPKDDDQPDGPITLPIDSGLAGLVARTGVALRADDARTAGGYAAEVDEIGLFNRGWPVVGAGAGGHVSRHGGNPLAVLAVPVRGGDTSVAGASDVVAVLVAVGSPPGSVGAGHEKTTAQTADGCPAGFSNDDVHAAQALAARARVYVRNASDHEADLADERTGRRVITYGQELATKLDMREAEALLARAAAGLVRAKHTRMLLVDSSGHPPTLRALASRDTDGGEDRVAGTAMACAGLLGTVVNSNEPVNTLGANNDAFHPAIDTCPAAKAAGEAVELMCAAPVLSASNTTLGVLQITNRLPKSPRQNTSETAVEKEAAAVEAATAKTTSFRPKRRFAMAGGRRAASSPEPRLTPAQKDDAFTDQEVGTVADLAAQVAVPMANSESFAKAMAMSARRGDNNAMMAGLQFPEALAAMTAHIKAAVSAECARVLIVERPKEGPGGENNGDNNVDERYMWAMHRSGHPGGGSGHETEPGSPAHAEGATFTRVEYTLDDGITSTAIRSRRVQNVAEVRGSVNYQPQGVDGTVETQALQSLMAAPVMPRKKGGAAGDVIAVVQVANKVRAQVKTFTREDEQVLQRLCSEELPVAIANAVVADRETLMQRRARGLFDTLRAVKEEMTRGDGDSVKLQPVMKTFQMNVCDALEVDDCVCFVAGEGADGAWRLLGWNPPEEDEDGGASSSRAVTPGKATTPRKKKTATRTDPKGHPTIRRADGDPVAEFDSNMRLMSLTMARASVVPGETVVGGGENDEVGPVRSRSMPAGGGIDGMNEPGAVQPRCRVACRALVPPAGGNPLGYLAVARHDTHGGFDASELGFIKAVTKGLSGLIIVPNEDKTDEREAS